MKKWFHIQISLLLCICFNPLEAQTYNFKNYSVEDGLAQSQVLSLFEDNKGYIWCGTNEGGVSKFDGTKFQTYTTKNGLVSNLVYSIDQDSKGNLYFATFAGLSVFNGQTFKNYTEKEGLALSTTFNVFIDRKQNIWIGTQQGVYNLVNGKIIPFKKDSLLNKCSVFSIYEDGAGNIWFGTIQKGAIRYSPSANNAFSYFNMENKFLDNGNFVMSFNEDHRGNIILGTVSGAVIISAKGEKSVPEIPRQEYVGFTSILKDNQNTLWFSGANGVYKYNHQLVNHFTVDKGLPGNAILCSIQDREGNYWFGTDGFGLSKLTSEVFTNYSSINGLPGEYVTALFEDSKKNIWIAIKDNGVLKLVDGKLSSFTITAPLPNRIIDNIVQSITEDANGCIWLGTQTGISIIKENKVLKNISKGVGLKDTMIYSVFHDKNVTYVGTRNGLFTYNGSEFKKTELIPGINPEENHAIYQIHKSGSGSLWLASNKGLIELKNSKPTVYNAKNGLIDKPIYSVTEDNEGSIWLGSENGIYCLKGGKFSGINDTSGLTSNQVYLLLIDKQNNLWVGTNTGLSKIDLHEYQKGKLKIKHFGKEEGLKGLECNINAAMQDAEGKIWFGTVKGATIYNPRFDKINHKEALTRITDIRLFFEKSDLKEFSNGVDSLNNLPLNLRLPFSKNHITFDFIGICHANPSKVLYQFKLEGADENWSPPTSRTDVTYSSLQPGDYTFYLKAMNNDGIWNETPISFKFTILPPWYRTWWFYTICIFMVGSGIYLYNVWKTKKLREDKIKLEKIVDQRTHELREEKEKVEEVNKEVLAQKSIIEHKNHEITDSIKYAKDIQTALLSARTLLSKPFPDSFALYMPKDIVSGDFYWFAKRGGKHFFASCDCTGHGVPGAFMSIIGNSLLNEVVAEHNILEPAKILDGLHTGVKQALNHGKSEFERRDGMDVALCAVDLKNMKLEYAGANRPLWLFRKEGNGLVEIIKANKFPIGGLELEANRAFTNHEISIQSGDCIYVFSDGYADQFGGESGKKMMVGNLQKLLLHIHPLPMHEQHEILQKHFNDWKGNHEQVDDVLIIGVRIP